MLNAVKATKPKGIVGWAGTEFAEKTSRSVSLAAER